MADISDGLEELRLVMGLGEIMTLIERTARWVAPETFKLLPVWFPEHSRRGLFYKKNWTEPQMNTNRTTLQSVHKSEGNVYANAALTLALGLRKKLRPNWSCCHIWGVDDVKFQQSNVVVTDRRFYSCIGNMVLLPTPLKAFTDAMPEIKTLLRICARNLYGWPHDDEKLFATNVALNASANWSAYPESWPRFLNEKRPPGTVPLSPTIEASVRKRIDTIRRDLDNGGKHYPRNDVRAVLAYWKVEL